MERDTPNPPVPLEEIQAGLARIRTKRRWSHLPFLAALLGSLAFNLAGRMWPEASSFARPVLTPIFLVAIVCIFAVPVVGLRCPRCRGFFHAGGGYRNDFARKCRNCGLRLDGKDAADAV
jgi:hypothetical protein